MKLRDAQTGTPMRRSRRLSFSTAGVVLLVSALHSSARTAALAQQPTCMPGVSTDQRSLEADPRYVRIAFRNACGDSVPLAVDLAATSARQERGLMEVSFLPSDQGELFVFTNLAGGNEVQVGFWNYDVPISLSIAFIGKDGILNEIIDMQAETDDLHTPQRPFLYAVETNQGWFARHGIVPGSPVDLNAAIALLSPAP